MIPAVKHNDQKLYTYIHTKTFYLCICNARQMSIRVRGVGGWDGAGDVELLFQQALYKAPLKGHRSQGFNKGYIGNDMRNIQLISEIYN